MYVLKNKIYKLCVFPIDLLGTLILAPFRLFGARTPKNVNRILVIRLDHVGDVVASTPVFRCIKQAYPNCKLDVLVSKINKELIANNPFIDGIMVYDAPWFKRRKKTTVNFREFFGLARTLKKQKYDLGIDLRGDFRHIILMLISNIKFKTGYGITGGGFLLDKEIGYDMGSSQRELNLNLLKSIGISVIYEKPGLFLSNENLDFADRFFKDKDIKNDDFVICIHAGAGFASKRWLPQKWAELINSLIKKHNAKIILCGAKEDKHVYNNIKSMLKGSVIDAVEKTSLGELAALLKKANIFIGTDSGPSHIAAAMHTLCIILYSGTNAYEKWAPVGGNVTIIQKTVPCAECGKTKCANNICMDLITVQEVEEAVKKGLRIKD